MIAAHVSAWLTDALRDQECDVYNSDMRVYVERTGLFTYPDVSVSCGEAELLADTKDTLLNPRLIVEVLSPSTESYDRGKKFAHYRQLESLQEYILVSQEEAIVERFSRTDGDRWILDTARGREESLSLGVTDEPLPLSEVYRRVVFDQDTDQPADAGG